MGNDLGISLGQELGTAGFELAAQFVKILDNAVMNHGDAFSRMRMGVVLVGTTVGGPARMTYADRPR